MVTITKIFGVLSCGFLLCLGLSHAARAENAASAAYELKAEQSEHKHDGQMSDKREDGHSIARKTIKGKVLRVEGDNVFIKRQEEVRVHVDKTTQMEKSIEPGELIEVMVNDQNDVLSILLGSEVTDRRNSRE